MTLHKLLCQNVIPVFPHQVLQCVAHQFLLQSFHQSHLNGLGLVLRLAVGAEPLRQNRSILRSRDESRNAYLTGTFVQIYECKNMSNKSVKAHLCSTLDTDRDGVNCPNSKFISSLFWHVIWKLTDTDQWSSASTVANSPSETRPQDKRKKF